MTNDPRYPIGKFQPPAEYTPALRKSFIREIRQLPEAITRAVEGLDAGQLDTPYREGGWTVRQLVHHLADSHMNAYVRFKLALTEDEPMVKTYEEGLWAELEDARTADTAISLHLLEALHRRWVIVLQAMDDGQFARCFKHPELGRVELNRILALYAWHSRHHVAHVLALREQKGW